MKLLIDTKPFSFRFTQKLITARGVFHKKTGMLIKLKDSKGKCGWGEVSPFDSIELNECKQILNQIGKECTKNLLESNLSKFPSSLAFGLGASLSELDNLNDNKMNFERLVTPEPSYLLPTNSDPIDSLIKFIKKSTSTKSSYSIKWKVSNQQNIFNEKKMLKDILDLLPKNFKLRIDPNGSWSRQKAKEWVDELKNETRLEWIEQPLPAQDIEGLYALADQIPIALDESLVEFPYLRKAWKSWQIRRPALDGDPRALLKEINQESNYIVISTAFETGIGRRWINYLAAMQAKGTHPSAPGLAPGWRPQGELFSNNPKSVWEAA